MHKGVKRMKKVYIICILIVVVLGGAGFVYSYRYFSETEGQEFSSETGNLLPETKEAVVREEDIITKDTRYYIETYDINSNTVVREPNLLPSELLGKGRSQFANYLQEIMTKNLENGEEKGLLSIELTKFNPEEVIVRKTYKEPEEEYEFSLDVQLGRVIVRNQDGSLYAYTEIKFETLPEELKREILSGFFIENLEELYEFLETYSS